MADRDMSDVYPIDAARAADAAAYRERGLDFLADEGLLADEGCDDDPTPVLDSSGDITAAGQTWPTNYQEWFEKGWPLIGTGP
jgi:hypothetical protein